MMIRIRAPMPIYTGTSFRLIRSYPERAYRKYLRICVTWR